MHLIRFLMPRVIAAVAFTLIGVLPTVAHAQTTLNATYTSTPWDNASSLSTGSGLTLNLGLGFEYLIVGGGGGGGGNIGGGGGAGGLLTNVGGVATPQASGNYTVTVGAGGAGGNTNNAGANGAASSIFGLSASGGGGGAYYDANTGLGSAGSSGASGGGGSPSNSGGAGGGGVTGSGTGNVGGSGVNTQTNGYRAGGGGGAGSAGASTSSTVTGTGGSGITSTITGATLTLAGGGGGGANIGANFGIGGSGIGGSGASGAANGSNGQANTGSGGGGAGYNGGFSTVVGGSGGSGLVIVRYQSDTRLASGGSSSGTTGVWQFERFNSSGTFALSYVAANLLATQSGTISGAGGLTYTGAGTLNLTAANTFSGNTRVSSGTLNLANVGALQNSTLDLATADTGAIGLTVAGTNTYTFGGLQGSRNLAIGANSLSVGGNNASTTYSGALSGSGRLTKVGTGSLTLSGSSAHSGGTTLSAGSLLAGNDSALGTGTLTFASGGVTLGTTANRTLANPIALAASGTIAAGIHDLTLSGPITGSGGLAKTGTGTLTISGSNSYSGGTVVAGAPGANGVLRAGSNQAFGSGTVTVSGTSGGMGNTLDVNGATLANVLVIPYVNSGVNDTGALQNTNTSTAAVLNGNVIIGGQNYVGGNGDIVLNGIVSGGTNNVYSLYKQGTGTWTFANPNNTFDGLYYQIGGVTEVTKLANAGEASSLGQVSSSQNTFVFGFTGSGGGTLRYVGATASTSDRVFSLRGATAAANNTIEAAGTSPAATLTLTGGLTAGAAGSYTARLTGTNAGVNDYAGVIADGSAGGTVALVKEGSTTWALTGANSYSGATTVTSGTLKVGNGGTTGSLGSGSVTTNARLAFDRTNSLTVANAISGTGTLEQAGTGITLLTGNNSFSGSTLVSSGTLSVGNGGSAGTLGTSTVSIAAGATLAVNRSDTFTLANAIGGAGRILKQGANSLTLSGTNTHTGGVSLAGGTLVVGSDAALGSGTLTIAASGVTVSTTRSLVAPIDVAASGTLAAGGNAITLSGVLSGNGTLSKTGTGTLTLAGANSTFSGNLVIAGGAGSNSIVRAGNVSAFGTGTVTILGGGGNTGSTFDLNGNSLDNSLVIGLGNSGVGDTGALQNSNAAVPAILNGGVSLGGEIYVGGPGDIRFNGLVSGTINPANPYSLYKDGAGTWTFANTANTFTGFYYQVGGATEVTKLANQGQASSLGAPSNATENRVSFGFNGSGGGTLRFIGGAASTSDRVFVLAGGTAASNNVIEASGSSAAATLTLTGALSANRAGSYAATLGGTNAGVNEYAGVISNGSGTVSLVKDGSTTWALTGANSYTGATTIAGGTLQVGSGGTAGVLGGTGTIANDGTLAFNRSDTVTLSRAITGTGGFRQMGSGTITLSGANSYTGGTVVSAGRLVGDAASLQGGITNDAVVEFAQATSGTYAGSMNGLGLFMKSGAGSLTLTGSSGFTGTTRVEAGVLALGTGGSLAAASSLELVAGGTMNLAGNAQTFSGISGTAGTIALDAGTLTVNNSGTNTFGGAITGAGGLVKSAVGNLILTGSSNFTGPTSVSAGRLSVNGVLGNSPVTVLALAELGGSGSIAGSVSVAAGGTLSPGNSIASLAAGATSFASGATFEYEVDSTNLGALSTAADLLVVNGNLNIASGALLTLTDLAGGSAQPFVNYTTIFAMINYTGSWNSGLFTYDGNELADGERFFVGSQQWEIDYNRTSPVGLANFTSDYQPSSKFVAITAVPEPSTLVLLGIGGAIACWAARRRA